MLVLIAGMPRSGSTFSFNVVRDILRVRGRIYQSAPPPDILPELAKAGNDVQHLLLKMHQLDETAVSLVRYGAALAICTIRHPPEDAVASQIKIFGQSEESCIALIRDWLTLYAKLRPFALSVDYSLIDRYPLLAAWRIARFVAPDAKLREIWRTSRLNAKVNVKKITDSLPREGAIEHMDFTYYDPSTFYHRRHIGSLKSRSAQDLLPAEQLQRIRNAFQQHDGNK